MTARAPTAPSAALVARVIAALDLTTLARDDAPERLLALCARAASPAGGAEHCAAVCSWPRFAALEREALDGTGVRAAVVAGDFPHGTAPLADRVAEVRAAHAAGAQEIDVVLAPERLRAGSEGALAELRALRAAAGGATLKVILETGALADADEIRSAAGLAVAAGADFLKTSTGKRAVGATPEAVAVLCAVVRERLTAGGSPVGIKVAGGVRTAADAVGYLLQVERALGTEATTPERFRIGASTLIDELAPGRGDSA